MGQNATSGIRVCSGGGSGDDDGGGDDDHYRPLPVRLDQLLAMVPRPLPQPRPRGEPLPPPTAADALQHVWNPNDRSLNMTLRVGCEQTVYRRPVAQSTDAIRGCTGYARGLHVWKILWPVWQRGTHPMVGVGTKQAALHCTGYTSLVGNDGESWGWDLTRNKLYHDNKNTPPASWTTYPPYQIHIPEAVTVVLDMDEGTLSFMVGNRYLGVAHRGLKGKTLYPMISTVWGRGEVSIHYVNGLDPEPLLLMDLCRKSIRLAMGTRRVNKIDTLSLPRSLKVYLHYRDSAPVAAVGGGGPRA